MAGIGDRLLAGILSMGAGVLIGRIMHTRHQSRRGLQAMRDLDDIAARVQQLMGRIEDAESSVRRLIRHTLR